MKTKPFLVLAMLMLFGAFFVPSGQANRTDRALPVKGIVTMVDIGADKCIPCKMMAPILEELREEYRGKAVIAFVDVWKNPSAAKQYEIRVIPTQVFYDAKGKEQFRHQGFLAKEQIVLILKRLGVANPGKAN